MKIKDFWNEWFPVFVLLIVFGFGIYVCIFFAIEIKEGHLAKYQKKTIIIYNSNNYKVKEMTGEYRVESFGKEITIYDKYDEELHVFRNMSMQIDIDK